jgi:site-specific DNA-methyltransferase (adenine-specific)
MEYFTELSRVSENQIIWGGNYFGLPATRCFLIWDKQQPEGISFASAEYAWTSFDQSAKTFRLRPQGEDRIHPTQKPVKLYRWIMYHFCKVGNPAPKILDTHLGSGSSAIAAHQMGFDFVGCEIDKDYYNAACKRFKEQTMQQDLFKAS